MDAPPVDAAAGAAPAGAARAPFAAAAARSLAAVSDAATQSGRLSFHTSVSSHGVPASSDASSRESSAALTGPHSACSWSSLLSSAASHDEE